MSARVEGAGRTVAALLAADLAALTAAAGIGLALATAAGAQPDARLLGLIATNVVLVMVGTVFAGLYPAMCVARTDELRRMSIIVVGTMTVLVASTAMSSSVFSVAPLVLAGLLSVATVPLSRAAVRHAFHRRPWWGVPVVILGAGEAGAVLLTRLARFPNMALRPIAFLDDETPLGSVLHGVPVAGRLDEARRLRAVGVHHAILAMPDADPVHVCRVMRRHGSTFRSVTALPNLTGFACIAVSTRTIGGRVALQVKHNLLSRRSGLMKALLDVVLLVPATLVALPIIALTALWISAVSQGSPFYAQEREGRNGHLFRVWKLRTMHQD
ncbi:MAG: sugar transferase, partial [Gemmatimonadaceae bacterium]|nr:sugar transferase [Gemmatimonadaceae bacterium]